MRKSIFDKFSKNELQELIDSSNSIKEIFEKVGLTAKGTGTYVTFYKRVESLGLDISDIKRRARNSQNKKIKKDKTPLSEILVENSAYSRGSLKKRLLLENILQNVCSICGQLPEWNGKPLTLQLDHINGISNDNRIENLRIVCPHCHSQLETSFNKNKRNKCIDCGAYITSKSIRCSKCAKSRDRVSNRKFKISGEELERLIKVEKVPFTKIGEMFGVSDNAIRKRAKKMGII